MRPLFVVLHRWLGLATALFLFVAGLTGAIISWDHELDGWLNPALYDAASGEENHGSALRSPLEMAQAVEAADTRVRVTLVPLSIEPGHTVQMGVEARNDPFSDQLGFNQMALDPATGVVQGKRMWGAISLSPENLLPFLYKLHYSLHIPSGWGIELGIWLMGIVGIIWIVDGFIALVISFPNLKSWRKSFAFRWKQGAYKLNFDLHRSGGMWLWGLLLVLAVTSVSMNLGVQVVRPLVSVFSTLAPDPFTTPKETFVEPQLSREQVVDIATAEALRRGWDTPPGMVFYSQIFGIYGVGFFEAGNAHGDVGLGNPWLYFDAQSGAPAGEKVPGEGSAGDIFMHLQFPLHSGRILGLPGRILISIMGLVVAMLSVTGVYIWLKKRAARLHEAAQRDVDCGTVGMS